MASIDTAVALLKRAVDVIEHCDTSTGVCCCGDNMKDHPSPMTCGHVARDEGHYYADSFRTDVLKFLGEQK